MSKNTMRFEDGSTIAWTSRESVTYTESGYMVEVWVDMGASFFSRDKIIKLESLKVWNHAPPGAELSIPEDKRLDIAKKIKRFYAGRPIEVE
jgi:hypothetical protein